jgi:fumarate reductase subunit C
VSQGAQSDGVDCGIETGGVEGSEVNARAYFWQRLTALVMAPLVFVHLGVMVYAINDGLTAAEILGRTRGSVMWAAFYGAFVLAAAGHAAIGLRTVLGEWAGMGGAVRNRVAVGLGVILAVLGLRAVYAVVM